MDAVLQFTVSNQRIDRTDVFTIVEGSDNYLKAQFSFTADWNGMIKTGVFIDEDGNVHPSLCINDICDVPTEWLVKQRGAVGVIGSDGVTKITTDAVKVRIRDKGYTGEGIDEDSMDGYFDQIMQAFAESQEFVNLKADQAEEAEKSAEAWTHGHEDYPERDQDNAKYYANVTQQNAEQTSGDRSETQRLSEQVSQAERKVSVDKEVVEELKAQVQADAEAALRSEQRAKASETASKENRTGAEAAKGLAEVYAKQTEMDKNTVEQAKADVMQMDQNVAEAKASVEQIVEAFSRTAEQAVTDVKNTGQEQIENIHLAGEKVVGDVENIKAAAVRNIQDEGKIQVQNVQAAAAEIEADRDQIQQNKDEITTLKSEARYDASAIVESDSGKLITVNNSADKPFVNMKIYGRTTQDGTPTPENPVELVSAGDKGSVEISITNEAESVQTLTMITPNGFLGIPVTSGGNYTDETDQQWIADYRDWERGVDVQMVPKAVFDGSEDIWRLPVSDDDNAVFCNQIGTDIFDYSDTCNFMCNMLANPAPCTGYQNALSKGVGMYYYISGGHKYLYFVVPTSVASNVAEWKAYLSENNLEILYEVNIPIETPIPPEELAVYRSLHSTCRLRPF